MEMKNDKIKQVFENIHVVEFAAIAAGPLIGKHLADHGAEVIHVESRERPDGFRLNYPPYKDNKPGLNRSGAFTICNNNKYGITLNLKAKGAIEVAYRLIRWADIIIENFTPGTMKKLGLGYEDIKKIKPDIIMLSTCNQGQTGPHALHPGFGSHLSSLCGFTYITGYKDRLPVILYGPYVDHVGVGYGVIAVIAALLNRRKTGEGQYIDLSQYEVGIQFMIPALLEYNVNNRIIERDGNRHPFAAPHNAYRCKGEDRWCVISIFSDEEWEKLCKIMKRDDLLSDPRFKNIILRKQNEAELDKEIEIWTSRFTAEEVFNTLQENGIMAGIVETMEDIFFDPQLNHRGFWPELNHPEVGRFHAEAPPFILSKTRFKIDQPAPCLGEHNELVFKKFLGYSDDEYEKFIKDGIIW